MLLALHCYPVVSLLSVKCTNQIGFRNTGCVWRKSLRLYRGCRDLDFDLVCCASFALFNRRHTVSVRSFLPVEDDWGRGWRGVKRGDSVVISLGLLEGRCTTSNV